MPKAKPSFVSSPAKSPRSRRRQEAPKEPVDESQWRESLIPVGTTICKSHATQQYRLKGQDFEGLTYRQEEKVMGINDEDVVKPMYLYQECDVELTAWRKHGGPDAFDAYLNKLAAAWDSRSHKTDFQRPGHSAGVAPTLTRLPRNPPSAPKPTDRWSLSSGLLQIKNELPTWLWRKLNMALDTAKDRWTVKFTTLAEREQHLRRALQHLGPYPPRPVDELGHSPSLDALRDILGRAPLSAADPMMDSDEDYEGEVTYFWKNEYYDELFRVLIAVIHAHGLGDEGWATARWEVYDKYTQVLGGITCGSSYGNVWWIDEGKEWLKGWIQPGKDACAGRGYIACELGLEYNALLPR